MRSEVSLAKISTLQQSKLAYIYLRQSSMGQVRNNQESTALQYQLAERAALLGWPGEQIKIIDEDLGKSGKSIQDRHGFQNLIAEIGLGKVGLVLSLDASRLARNNSNWYKLLELCSIFSVLIADAERIYDLNTYHDRLLLGLSGLMSEAELHQIKIRLQNGARNKAERGELKISLPVGYVRLRSNEVILNPDEEVQQRIKLVFQKFKELSTANAVVRYLHKSGLYLPARPLNGPSPHAVIWRMATNTRVLQILKNPTYAGAYVYGRRIADPTKSKQGRPGSILLPMNKWLVCLQGIYPTYIAWEEYLANQEQLSDNRNLYEKGKTGAARKGSVLLQGIAFCGLCSRRMRLRYSGNIGQYPVYECNADVLQDGKPCCQAIRALQVDDEVERIVLTALAPDRLVIALESLSQIEEEAKMLKRQWDLKLERARYEAERARRQYDAVEPENRLVARNLERHWEEKLRQAEQVEEQYQTWLREHKIEITEQERAEILALGENLPDIWHAPSTSPQQRKQIIRFIIKDVVLDQQREIGYIWIKINWQTGACSEHKLRRKTNSYENYSASEEIKKRILELNAEQKMDAEIARQLNAEGFVNTKGGQFNGPLIHLLRKRIGAATVKINGNSNNPLVWSDGTYSVAGVAQILQIHQSTVFQWLRCGKLTGVQLADGQPWKIHLTPEFITQLKASVRRVNQSS